MLVYVTKIYYVCASVLVSRKLRDACNKAHHIRIIIYSYISIFCCEAAAGGGWALVETKDYDNGADEDGGECSQIVWYCLDAEEFDSILRGGQMEGSVNG